MKTEKSTLKERMESEGFGDISFQEGIEKPEYSEEYVEDVEKSEKDQLKGGLADGETITSIAKKHKVDVVKVKEQLKMGIEVEMEHTDDPTKAVEIAMDHLVESPIYYTELAKMENKLKKNE